MEDEFENRVIKAWEVRELDPELSLSIVGDIEQKTAVTSTMTAPLDVLKSYHHSRVLAFRETLDCAARSLDVLRSGEDPLWLARAYGRLAIGFHALGDIVSAYRHYRLELKTAELIESSDQREELFLAYHNFARHYFEIGDIKRAERNLGKAHDYVSRDDYQFGFLQLNYAQCSVKKNDLELASAQAMLAIDIGQRMHVPRICHYALPVLAQISALTGDSAEAERLYLDAVALAVEHNFPQYQVLLQLLELFLGSGKIVEAQGVLNRAAEAFDETDDKIHAAKFHKLATIYYEQKNDHKAALKHYKDVYRLEMEVFSIQKEDRSYAKEVAQRIEVLEAEYVRLKSHNQELQQKLGRLSEQSNNTKKAT